MKIKLLSISGAVCLLGLIGAFVVEKSISQQIASRVEQSLPNASGVSASFPLSDLPNNLTSESIKSANIEIEEFVLNTSDVNPSLFISATNIGKTLPTVIGNIDITATISAADLTLASGFESAKIVGNALQVPVGEGGWGNAMLIPRFKNNELYFEIQTVMVFGNEISVDALPAEIKNQVKTKSLRKLNFPESLTATAVSLNEDGLSIRLTGKNFKVTNLAPALKP